MLSNTVLSIIHQISFLNITWTQLKCANRKDTLRTHKLENIMYSNKSELQFTTVKTSQQSSPWACEICCKNWETRNTDDRTMTQLRQSNFHHHRRWQI